MGGFGRLVSGAAPRGVDWCGGRVWGSPLLPVEFKLQAAGASLLLAAFLAVLVARMTHNGGLGSKSWAMHTKFLVSPLMRFMELKEDDEVFKWR